MQIVYIHGLNSDHTAEKGKILDEYCQQYHPQIKVHRPNLNMSPAKVEALLKDLIAQDEQTGLVGSSLGGYFATLLANQTGKKAVLLNPSLEPHQTLQRFFPEDKAFETLSKDYVATTTDTGWEMTKADIEWLAQHRVTQADYPHNMLVIVKTGDELLDYQVAVDFFSESNSGQNGQSHIIIEEGGDHRMTDFSTKLPQVVKFLFGLSR